MALRTNKMLVFSGNSNRKLTEEIAKFLKIGLGRLELSYFSDGEIYVRSLQSVRGAHVFAIQSVSPPVNKNLMELLIMIDAFKRASAERISAVVPYYGYSRQDRKAAAREPITAKLVADLLSTAGVDRLVTMDLHAGQIQGFFNVPVDHLTALPTLARCFRKKRLKSLVVVSPDVGRVKIAKKCADKLGATLAVLHKSRSEHNVAEVTQVVGEVKGKPTLLIDDMIDTGGTIVEGAEALIQAGAKEIYACATHPIFSPPAVERLKASPIKEVVVTNTIYLPDEKKFDKLKILSIAQLFGRAISNVYKDKSVSSLFKGDNHV